MLLFKGAMAILSIILFAFCMPAFGQITAEDWIRVGVESFNQSRYNEAVEAIDQAIALDPDNTSIWNLKSIVLPTILQSGTLKA